MRAAVYFKHGNPEDVLEAIEIDEPGRPGRGEVLVRVLLRPVHHGDLLGISGRYEPGSRIPDGGARIGFEGYGTIEEAGEGIDLQTGTRVAFFPGQGAWSDKVVLSAEYVLPIPDTVSDEVAAQIHVNPLTAALLLRAVEASGARPGRDAVVLTAAGSAVARLTIRLLLDRGYHVIGVVRREAGVKELNVLFPLLPVVSTQESDWQNSIVSAAGDRPIAILLDPVGGETASALAGLLSRGGSLISYGDLSDQPISVPALYFPTRNIRISGVSVGRWAAQPTEVRKADLDLSLELAINRPELFPVGKIFDLAEVSKAAAQVYMPGRAGTILLATR